MNKLHITKKYLPFLAVALPIAAFAQTATISTTDTVVEGTNVNTASQNAGTSNYFTNDGHTLLIMTNNSTTTVTATIRTQRSSVNVQGVGPVSLTDVSVTLPGSARTVMGPFAPGRWNTQQNTVGVSLTSASFISATALKVPVSDR